MTQGSFVRPGARNIILGRHEPNALTRHPQYSCSAPAKRLFVVFYQQILDTDA